MPKKKTRAKKKADSKGRVSRNASEPWPLDVRVAEIVEGGLGLRTRHGFGAPSFMRDRAEAYIRWERDDTFRLTVTFYGLERVENLGLGISPPDRNQAFGLWHMVKALDPALHARFHPSTRVRDEAGVVAWVEAHAPFFETHAANLFGHPNEVFAEVRRAEPLGEQCERLVKMCREVLQLETDHGFDAPETIHWGHQVEIAFVRGGLRLVIEIEDHEKAGVVDEPFTVPELYLRRNASEERSSLTEVAARLEPEHAARRPVADRYAMALDAVRAWLEHDAAFLRRHPELFE